jgi:beta-1,3-glucuronyltransferase S
LKVIGFFDSWPAKRIWPVDMAGFAINISFLKPNASMPFKAGYEEDQFLRNNHVTLDDIEPKANNCTEVYVWHTQTRKHSKSHLQMDTKSVGSNPLHVNLVMLIKKVAHLGMSVTNSKRGAIAYISKEGKSKAL